MQIAESRMQTNMARAAAEAGSALRSVYDRKVQRGCSYLPRQEQGLVFLPIAMETLGGLHQVAVVQLKRLVPALAWQAGEDRGVATRQLFQRVALGLMRGNAVMMVSRSPHDNMIAPEVGGTE